MLELISDRDKVSLTNAVFKRFSLLIKQAQRRGKVLDVSPSTHKALNLYNQMRLRYMRGEIPMTHTRQEAAAEQEVCQWLVSEWKRITS